MDRLTLVFLVALLLMSLSVRSLDTRADVPLYAMVLVTLGLAAAAVLSNRGDGTATGMNQARTLAQRAVWAWLLTALLLLYGLLLSAFAGHDMYQALSHAFRLVPIALFPAFVLAIRTRQGWHRLFLFMVGIAVASSLIDITSWLHRQETVVRLMSATYASVDYFYGFVLAVLLLLLVPMGTGARLLLIAALPPLALRTFLSISRGADIILLLVVVYAVVVTVAYLPEARLWVVRAASALTVLLLVFAYVGPLGPAMASYADSYRIKFNAIEMSLDYRWSEIRTAFGYGQLWGAGWGAEGDFSDVLRLTSSQEAAALKPYIHNLVGFLWWKLGALGLAFLAVLSGYVAREARRTVLLRDPSGFVVAGLWLAWALHAMVNMNFARTELNIWLAAWLGYLEWRRLRSPTPEPVSMPALRRSAQGTQRTFLPTRHATGG